MQGLHSTRMLADLLISCIPTRVLTNIREEGGGGEEGGRRERGEERRVPGVGGQERR